MTTNPDHNGYVIDAESPTEMARLINLDRFIIKGMGGALAGVPLEGLNKVLDLACGPGGWTLNVAYALPDAEVAGVDISKTMIDYARARATSQGIANASFERMNIAEGLDFSDNTFDLMYAHLATGWPFALDRDAGLWSNDQPVLRTVFSPLRARLVQIWLWLLYQRRFI
jgi:SAM-dependent methyltransferase